MMKSSVSARSRASKLLGVFLSVLLCTMCIPAVAFAAEDIDSAAEAAGVTGAIGENMPAFTAQTESVDFEASTFISTGEKVVQADAHVSHAGAVRGDGSLWMWGDNTYGQLGDGTTEERYIPVKVMDNAKSVYLGEFNTLALCDNGTLWAWGRNQFGQLGLGDQTDHHTPAQVMSGVASAATGSYDSGAVKTDGTLWTWGKNEDGELALGHKDMQLSPVQAMGGVSSFAIGYYHSVILKTDGSVWTVGDNQAGMLGNGTLTPSTTPVKVMDSGVKAIDASLGNTAVIKNDNTLWMWGYNGACQMGNGTYENCLRPVKLLDDVSSMALGNWHSNAVKTDGSVWLWPSSEQMPPVNVATGGSKVACGNLFTLLIGADGSLSGWGDNTNGTLGDGTTNTHQSFSQIFPLSASHTSNKTMYRLYNPNSGEHFYTANVAERNYLDEIGWDYEGIGWTAPWMGHPVYRLYNPNAGEHHYTTSRGEKTMLVEAGWNFEGIGWYSDVSETVPLYREYNPNQFANNHNYTANHNEHNMLVELGWHDEGISWYGVN